ncbi:PepSY domain-containing protein [Paenibacillus sp. sgz500992]|jgi:uncharacterized membrane protein YkoI|uniref:PepSY domain-containing protein n=1 Tax=Paenibacillus sp. sgz500992 TaxID=3242476 RepID=UPI0036D24EAA
MNKKWLLSVGLVSAVTLGSGALLHSAFAASNVSVKTTAQTTGQAVSDGDGETADDQVNSTLNSTQEQSDGDGEVADDQEQSDGDGEVADAKEEADLLKQAKISKQQSITLAQGQVKGTVKQVELEDEDGAVVYSVEIISDSKLETEVKVDAITGKIIKVEKADASYTDNNQQEQDTETADE